MQPSKHKAGFVFFVTIHIQDTLFIIQVAHILSEIIQYGEDMEVGRGCIKNFIGVCTIYFIYMFKIKTFAEDPMTNRQYYLSGMQFF